MSIGLADVDTLEISFCHLFNGEYESFSVLQGHGNMRRWLFVYLLNGNVASELDQWYSDSYIYKYAITYINTYHENYWLCKYILNIYSVLFEQVNCIDWITFCYTVTYAVCYSTLSVSVFMEFEKLYNWDPNVWKSNPNFPEQLKKYHGLKTQHNYDNMYHLKQFPDLKL